MKTICIATLALTANAINNKVEMAPSKHDLYRGDWNGYQGSRMHANDCDVRESENWLGSGQCKYSWECRGARMCEGNGFCLGNDACDEISGAWKRETHV